jgi:hypothetical protein
MNRSIGFRAHFLFSSVARDGKGGFWAGLKLHQSGLSGLFASPTAAGEERAAAHKNKNVSTFRARAGANRGRRESEFDITAMTRKCSMIHSKFHWPGAQSANIEGFAGIENAFAKFLARKLSKLDPICRNDHQIRRTSAASGFFVARGIVIRREKRVLYGKQSGG